jgi:SAM-dependent methyltransferase
MDRVLDIGCGPGDMLNYLPAVHYVGFDASEAYIARARQRFGRRGQFYCGLVNSGSISELHTFDIVLAHGVLHHLGDAEASALFALARAALRPGGWLVTFDGCYAPNQSRLARWFVSRDRGRYVREVEEYRRLANSAFDRVHVTVRHDLLRIPYTHIIMECAA